MVNKNAFQKDAYRPLQWPLGGGGGSIPAYTGQGVCLYPSMHWAGGVSQHALGRERGVSLGVGGVSAWEGVCLGVSAQGGYLPGGMCIPVCTGRGGVVVARLSQHALGRGCLPGGVCLGWYLPKGVSPGGCLPRGMSAWRGVSAQGSCLP